MNSQQNIDQQIGIGSEEQTKLEHTPGSFQASYIDVIAAMPGSEDKELIKNVRVDKDINGNILVSTVCRRLVEHGFNVTGMRVSYYSPIEQMYIFAGKDPIPLEKDGISVNNLSNNRLTLKFRPGQDNSPKGMPPAPVLENQPSSYSQNPEGQIGFTGTGMNMMHQAPPVQAPPPIPTPPPVQNTPMSSGPTLDIEEKEKSDSQDQSNMEIWSSAKANRRTKERKISFVIEKVSMWRKLYNGIQDNTGKIVRYSLEDAAKKVGISKKSLDDYLLQLRYGKKYGFDFNEHKEAKIGILRAFVKKKKQEEKDKQKGKMDALSD